ncbi:MULTISPECIES: hypothetical protein [Paenibacillus]
MQALSNRLFFGGLLRLRRGIASEDDISGRLTLNGGIIRPYRDGLE